jgi:HK97 family phage portal protein
MAGTGIFDLRSVWPIPFGGLMGLARMPGVQNGIPAMRIGPGTGVVSFDTAMQLSVVWACCKLISETVASLPFRMYEKTASGQWVEVQNHALVRRFNHMPNRYQTRVEFWESMLLNLVHHGNAYAHKVRGVAGDVVSLLPLMASQMEVKLMPDGAVVYQYNEQRGITFLAAENVWHIKLFGNGIVGLSPLQYGANSIGLGIAGERRASEINRNGGKPTGVLMLDKALTKPQRENIREEFKDLQEGNEETLMVLEAGMKYQQVSMTPEATQLLETRKFSVEDLARFYGVPSVLINDTQASTTWGSGIEQIVAGWQKLNLRPYFTRIEASADVHLLTTAEQQRYCFEFDYDAILRPDMKARIEAGSQAVNNGLITRNEWRAASEGLPPLPGGDQLTAQGALSPITMLGRAPARGGNNGDQAS